MLQRYSSGYRGNIQQVFHFKKQFVGKRLVPWVIFKWWFRCHKKNHELKLEIVQGGNCAVPPVRVCGLNRAFYSVGDDGEGRAGERCTFGASGVAGEVVTTFTRRCRKETMKDGASAGAKGGRWVEGGGGLGIDDDEMMHGEGSQRQRANRLGEMSVVIDETRRWECVVGGCFERWTEANTRGGQIHWGTLGGEMVTKSAEFGEIFIGKWIG